MLFTQTQPLLADRVVVVTGGTGGIGRAVCKACATQGAKVVIVDRDPATLLALEEEIASHIGATGRTLPLALDVSREEDMAAMAQQAVEHFGRIDVLIAAAGILRAPGTLPKPMAATTLDEWRVVVDVNLTGVFLSNRAVLPTMIAQRSGTIINVSSTSGRQGRAHDSAYCATKFGVIGLTESLAEEVRPHGIKAQVVLPDAVDTPLWDQNGPIKPDFALPPERVADLIVFMAALPADTLMPAPVIAPFRSRKRVPKGRAAAPESSGESVGTVP